MKGVITYGTFYVLHGGHKSLRKNTQKTLSILITNLGNRKYNN